ncbi:MAG: TolC family protein, partial [Verrucomicrobia bacterium]|nr:TolC family protein [Cytophagales bacterium]
AYLNIKSLKSLRYPLINAFTGINRNYGKQQAALFPNSFNSTVLSYGLSANVTIFNGNNLNRQIQNARIIDQSAQYQIDDLKQQLLASIEQTYLQYQNSLTLASLEGENLKVARQNVEIALERYKAGVTTSIEIRQVQQNAIATESRLIDALYNAKLAEIELLRLSSKIVEE